MSERDVQRLSGDLICITGIDGSGKTTTAKGIAEEIDSSGAKSKYVWGKHRPILLYPFYRLAQILFLQNEDAHKDYQSHKETKNSAIDDHPVLVRIYLSVMLIDQLFQIAFKVQIPLLLGQTVVCDRYIFDTVIVDIASDFGFTDEKAMRWIHLLMRLAPTPDSVVLIDVPEEISLERKDDIPSEAYLRQRRDRYHKFVDRFNLTVVDGTKQPNEVQEAVIESLLEQGKS